MAQVKALIGNIKGPAGKDGSENQIYSTDEQVIGKWIDGKPIYRKTMQFSGLHSGENNIAHGIADADLIIVDKNHSFLVLTDVINPNTTYILSKTFDMTIIPVEEFEEEIKYVFHENLIP